MPLDFSALLDPALQASNAFAESLWKAREAELQAAEATKKAAEQRAADLAASTEAWRRWGANIDDAAKGLGTGLKQLASDAVWPLTAPLGMLGSLAWDLTKSFAVVTGAASLFVSASNPGEMILFTRAIQDARASIGVFLEPLIRAGTIVLDSFNRMFTELQPILLPIFELLGGAMKDVADVAIALFQPVLEALAPAMESLLTAVQPLMGPLSALAAAVGDFVGLIVNTFASALEMVLPTVTDLLRGLADVLTTTITTIQIVIERLRNWDISGALNIGSALEQARERMAIREEERLRRRAGTGPGTVAARTPQLIGIEELGVQARLAAFGARTAESQRDQMIRHLRNIENRLSVGSASPSSTVAVWGAAGQAALAGLPGGAQPIRPAPPTGSPIAAFGAAVQSALGPGDLPILPAA
jgi:hypothetical protein